MKRDKSFAKEFILFETDAISLTCHVSLWIINYPKFRAGTAQFYTCDSWRYD